MPTRRTSRAPKPRRSRESAFTIVELIIVMVIIGILMVIGGSMFMGSKSNVKRQEAVVAAHSLQKAVEAFRRDHEGRVPNSAGDWSTADTGGTQRGPMDTVDVPKPYMQGTHPTHIGMRVLGFAGAPAPYNPTALLRIDYAPTSETTYTISMYDLSGGNTNAAAFCVLTDASTATTSSC